MFCKSGTFCFAAYILRNVILPYFFVQSSDLGRNEVENFHLKFVLTALNGNFFLSLSYSTPLNINTIAARVVLKELQTVTLKTNL